jgi:hypothetical protein
MQVSYINTSVNLSYNHFINEMGRACSTNGGEEECLVGNPEGKRPLGRPRRRWVDNIKMDVREIGWNGGDWIDLA